MYLACGHEKISFPYYRYPGGCRSQKKTPSLLLIRPNSLYYPTHIICICNTICFFLPSLSLCIIFLPSVHVIVYAATQNKEFAQLLINWQNKFIVHVSHSFSKRGFLVPLHSSWWVPSTHVRACTLPLIVLFFSVLLSQ